MIYFVSLTFKLAEHLRLTCPVNLAEIIYFGAHKPLRPYRSTNVVVVGVVVVCGSSRRRSSSSTKAHDRQLGPFPARSLPESLHSTRT